MAYLAKLPTLLLVIFLFLRISCPAQTAPPASERIREIDSMMNLRPQNVLRPTRGNMPVHFSNDTPNSFIKSQERKFSNNYPKVLQMDRSEKVNTDCQDTSVRLVFQENSGQLFAPGFLTKTKDGNILIAGYDFDPTVGNSSGHLVKCTQRGDTLWSRSIEGGYVNNSMNLYYAFELNDASILLVGYMNVPTSDNSRSDLMMLRLSSTGNLVWEKTFKTRLWDSDTNADAIDIFDCKQDANGDMYLAGDISQAGYPRQALAFKMDIAGTVLWSKAFTTGFQPTLNGVDINNLRVTFVGQYATNDGINCLGIVIDANSGDTLSSKILVPGENDFWHAFYEYNMVKLDNGNLALFGPGASDETTPVPPQKPLQYGILEVTPELNFVKSWLFSSNTPSSIFGSSITVFKDGSAAYTRTNNVSDDSADRIFGDFRNGQFLKERVIHYTGSPIFGISNFLQLDDGAQLISSFFEDLDTQLGSMELMRLHNSDTASTCLGKDTVATSVEKGTFLDGVPDYDSISVNVLTEDPRPFKGVFNNSFTISSGCKQVTFCDSLKIVIPHDTLCAKMTDTIHVRKNKECGAVPAWDYDASAVEFFNQINDTTFSISFERQWQGYIYANVNSCRTLEDSVRLYVLPNPVPTLDHSATLCSGASRSLDPGNFATYLWSDGSIGKTLLVNEPGVYFVSVTDENSCRGSDTTVITGIIPLPSGFLPKDTSVCSYSSLLLSPNSIFQSYLWNTGSNNSSITITQPGQYWLQVKTKDGCAGVDTIDVLPKNCLEGFFMPTAFTPNNDGKNDVIKPLLLGNVKQYRFWIYNRWGQLIFQTTDLSNGWNGIYKGIDQAGGVFVWVCTYQFEGEPLQNKKGFLVLIR